MAGCFLCFNTKDAKENNKLKKEKTCHKLELRTHLN